jgi:hypothetical protein
MLYHEIVYTLPVHYGRISKLPDTSHLQYPSKGRKYTWSKDLVYTIDIKPDATYSVLIDADQGTDGSEAYLYGRITISCKEKGQKREVLDWKRF